MKEIIELSGKQTTIVIDHLGHNDGDGSESEFKRWKEDLSKLAALEMNGGAEIVVKLGAIEEWGVGSPSGFGAGRMLDHALSAFGVERVLYESNWFVCAAYGEEEEEEEEEEQRTSDAAAKKSGAAPAAATGQRQTRAPYDATARAILAALERFSARDSDEASTLVFVENAKRVYNI